jgi:hypothetical protein
MEKSISDYFPSKGKSSTKKSTDNADTEEIKIAKDM